jgi:hypothetical protein
MPVVKREIREKETLPNGNVVERTIIEYDYLPEERDRIIEILNEESWEDSEDDSGNESSGESQCCYDSDCCCSDEELESVKI